MPLLRLPPFLALVAVAALLSASGIASAQTTLAQGDIAIVAADAADEQFSFVLLTDVQGGTVIRFSDIDLLAGGGTSEDNGGDGTGDGIAEVTLNALSAGAVVTVNLSGATLADPSQGSITITNSGFLLSTFGDSIVAYQGGSATSATGGTYLYYVELDDSNSQAPASLGADAVFLDGGDGFVYDTRAAPTGKGARVSGTVAELIAAFNDVSNYELTTVNFTPGNYLPAAFTITDGGPTITITPSSSTGSRLVLAEDGSRTFTVTLSEAPATDVTVSLSSGDATEASVPASVVVAASTTSQTFDVDGVVDGLVDGDQTVTITTGAATGDAAFAGTDPADIFLTVTDVDVDLGTELVPGDLAIVAVAPVNGGSSSIGGNDGEEFSFVLLTDVETNTQINFSDYTVSANGTIAEGGFDGIVTVTLNALAAGTVVTVNLNTGLLADGSQGTVAIVEGGFILSEFVGDAFFAYQGSPTSPSPGDFLYYTELPDSGSVPPSVLDASVVFQPGNLRGFYYDADGATEAPTSGSRDELLAAFNDVGYYVLPQRVSGVDDADRNPLDFLPDAFEILTGEGVITVSPLALTIAESAETATFDVTLSRAPGGDVTIPISSGNPAEATVSTSSLTFAAGTSTLTQTVTVTGVNDDLTDGDQVVTVAVGRATSRDAGYDMEDPNDVTVTVTDVGGRDNTVQFAAVQQAVLEDAGSVDLVIQIGGDPDEPTEVTVSLVSGDPDDLGGFTSATVTIGGENDGADENGQYVVTIPITDDARPEDRETFVFGLSIEDPDDSGGFALEVGGIDQTVLVVVDNDGDAVTVAVPASDGEVRLLSVPVSGATAADLAAAAAVETVFVLEGTGFVPAADDAVLSAGQSVLIESGGAFELTGSASTGALSFDGTAVADGGRVLFSVGNPTGAAVSLADLAVEGGTLADVVLVFDAALGAFRPVSLAGLDGDIEDFALSAYSAVIVQVTPAGEEAVSVTLTPGDASTGTLIEGAAFVPTDGETAVVLELRPQPSNGAPATETPGDLLALRVGIGDTGLDPFDGADVTSPLGGTLSAVGLVDPSAFWAALSVGDLAQGDPITIPLAVALPEEGFYQITLASLPSEIDGRPVLVEVFEGTRSVAVEDGTAFRFRATAADTVATPGRFSVRLSLGAGVATEGEGLERLSLAVFPNPSAGRATVTLTSQAGTARVAVYDALGREVAVLHDGPTAGDLRLGIGDLAPGMYVVRATGDGFVETRPVTVVR
ncbi:T9SS type A sorting domain-containing protein [Rubrivirga sp. IMCC43871]|uniref:T9SS type A sorting domain-containing protein n=1 Tax=Rubrivirga sp. IMCC43871 TaxID=3391575 RepID=UPI003990065C